MKVKLTFVSTTPPTTLPWEEVSELPTAQGYKNGYMLKIVPSVSGDSIFWINTGDETTAIWKQAGGISL